jgi:hypothetical protein
MDLDALTAANRLERRTEVVQRKGMRERCPGAENPAVE